MLPEHFYFTGAGWLGFFSYVPVVLFVIALLYWWRLRRISKPVIRWGITVVLTMTLVTLPLWEALSISYEAERLCKEQGGLHVYKTAETDGFLGGGSIKYWSKYGFNYIEGGCGKYGRLKCRKTLENGEEVYEEIPEWISQYALEPGETGPLRDGPFRINTFQVINRQAKEVLGDLVYFQIYPSRFDNLLLHVFQAEFNPWICGNEAPKDEGSYSPGKKIYVYGSDDVVKATLIPKKNDIGEAR